MRHSTLILAATLAALVLLAVVPASADFQIRVFIIPNWGSCSPCGGGYFAPPPQTWCPPPPPCGGYGYNSYGGYQPPLPAPSCNGQLAGYSNSVNYNRSTGSFTESGSARYSYPDGSSRRESWDNVPTLPYQSPW